MWHVIRRRRWFFDHFLLSLLPMAIFGPLSLAVWVYATVYWVVMGVEPVGGSVDKRGVRLVNGFSKYELNGRDEKADVGL